MEEMYWDRFRKTWKITDYLYYRGMQICACAEKEQNRKGEKEYESDYGDRHGACSDVDRRI